MPDTTITPTQVIADFGSYYLDAGQNQNDLLMRPYIPFGTLEAFTMIPTEDTVLRMSDVQVGEILQGYQDEYTPKGSVIFKPVTVDMFEMKIDQAFNPTKLVKTWLGFLTSNNTDRTTWPFVRWFIEMYVLKQSDEDLELKAIYTGEYLAPTSGTAGAANKVLNGVKYLINKGVDDSLITPIPTGTLLTDPVDFVDQIEDWVAQVPERYQQETMDLNFSVALRNRWRRGVRKKYNANYVQLTDLDKVTDFENITIKARKSQIGSNKIWMTPKPNAICAVKGYSNKDAFELEKVDRKVKLYTDWFMGINFLLGDLVFTNDLELNP